MNKNDCRKCIAPKRTLPAGAVFAGETPVFNEKTAPEAIRHRHLSPHGRFGLLSVLKGELKLVFEESGEHVTVTPTLPALIEPGRFHHVELPTGTEFKVQFYTVPETAEETQSDAPRPGEAYLSKS